PLAVAPAAPAQLVTLYPNPAHGTASLLLPQSLRTGSTTQVVVVDNLGRTVLTRTLSATAATLELPLDALRAGVYSVQAQTNAGLVAKRLVVN
ncbi:MAG: T9SS type A sorting domain-containing protein, partial [Hymenobacter sp.]